MGHLRRHANGHLMRTASGHLARCGDAEPPTPCELPEGLATTYLVTGHFNAVATSDGSPILDCDFSTTVTVNVGGDQWGGTGALPCNVQIAITFNEGVDPDTEDPVPCGWDLSKNGNGPSGSYYLRKTVGDTPVGSYGGGTFVGGFSTITLSGVVVS